MVTLRQLTPETSIEAIDGLANLLYLVVHEGHSLNFMADVAMSELQDFWRNALAGVGQSRCFWVAEVESLIVGCVYYDQCTKPNGRHRAEVLKMLTHPEFRGQGIARQLLEALEEHAQGNGIRTLFLDTEAGSGAESLYQKLGWSKCGEIPDYALQPDGTPIATSIYFKQI